MRLCRILRTTTSEELRTKNGLTWNRESVDVQVSKLPASGDSTRLSDKLKYAESESSTDEVQRQIETSQMVRFSDGAILY